MADNEFRSLRGAARDGNVDPPNEMSDPLAELARLIGQSDPHGAFVRDDDPADAYDEDPPARALDWDSEQHAEPSHEPADDDAPPAEFNQPDRSGADERPRDRLHDRAQAAPPQYSPPLFGDAHADRDGAEEEAPYDEEPPTADTRARGLPFVPPGRASEAPFGRGRPGAADLGDDDSGDYSDEDYDRQDYDEPYEPYEEERSGTGRRRSGIVVLGIFGLIVLGSAGAFGYRAMFGDAMFPALPPIIKPSSTPVKIVPNQDSQAAAPSQVAAASVSAGDHLVSHEENPVDVQAAAPVPHTVTTIPVISNTPPDGVWPGTQPPPASAAEAGEAQPAATPPAETEPPLPLPSEAKPVHTLAIHANEPAAATNPASGDATTASTRLGRERQTRAIREADTASAGPLSIVPGREAEAPSQSRARTAVARSEEPPPSASSAAEPGPTAGSYTVQVSSQRSEAEAQTAFRALQAKYPQQLGSQHGMVRRADLGAKGIYYRALVGPFASAEEASRLCSSLKAAGGSCLVQRN